MVHGVRRVKAYHVQDRYFEISSSGLIVTL